MTSDKPIRFGLVGGGWRAEFFTRVAEALPDRFTVAGAVLRDPQKAGDFAKRWHLHAYSSVEEMVLGGDLDFIVLSVKADAHVEYCRTFLRLGMPALIETPAALDLASVIEIWRMVEQGLRIQVAEQYLFQPLHAARLALIAEGRLGTVSSARVSAAHGYHGVSLMRHFLGIGFEDAKIRARQFSSPLFEGPGRAGPPRAERVVEATQTLGEFDFGDRLGLFDFTDMQYWSYVRSHRVVIRGQRGEIADLDLRYLKDFRTPVMQVLRRQDRGHNGDLYGYFLEGILAGDDYAFRNPFPHARLMDDEIAIAIALEKMGNYARKTGEGPYSFAEAAQDQYLSLKMAEAAQTGEVVSTLRQPWAG
jgi:predicted dehydrogenase